MRTLLEIRGQIKDDLDLWQDDFMSDEELNRHINDAIKKAEKIINTSFPRYFLTRKVVPVLALEDEVALPLDIYANKIVKIVYETGDTLYSLKRLKNPIDAEELLKYYNDATGAFGYMIINDADLGRIIKLYPSIRDAGSINLWYIRNAKKLLLDTDICDIDEFDDYIVQAAKTGVFLKDGDPRSADSKGLEAELANEMRSTLADFTGDDEDELIEMAVDFYNDCV